MFAEIVLLNTPYDTLFAAAAKKVVLPSCAGGAGDPTRSSRQLPLHFSMKRADKQ